MTAPIQPRHFDGSRPGRLWSLWEMLEAVGLPFWQASRHIAEFKALAVQCGKDMGPESTFGTVEIAGKRVFGKPMSVDPSPLSGPDILPMFTKQWERFERLLNADAKIGDLVIAINELQNRAEDELGSLLFYQVAPERVEYCMLTQPFGSEINDRFPAAIDDIEGASRCLGLGQGTACVLHLMRVMEVGLKALALALKIPYAPSWESYLNQISARISAKHKTKGVRWKRDEHFYRDISGDLVTIKQAWRNPTMHVGRKYSVEEAEEIFIAVKRFMYRLTTSVPVIQKKKS